MGDDDKKSRCAPPFRAEEHTCISDQMRKSPYTTAFTISRQLMNPPEQKHLWAMMANGRIEQIHDSYDDVRRCKCHTLGFNGKQIATVAEFEHPRDD